MPLTSVEGHNTEETMNTRSIDLNNLEEIRDQAKDEATKEKITSVLEAVYEQAKDPTLEMLRRELTQALKEKFENGPSPEIDYKLKQIEIKVKTYANSPTFKKNIAAKITKVSQKEAEIYYKKGR